MEHINIVQLDFKYQDELFKFKGHNAHVIRWMEYIFIQSGWWGSE